MIADSEIRYALEAAQFWIVDNPTGTLQQFADFLEEAFQQTACFNDDDVIEEIDYLPSELADYLQLWTAEGTGGEPHTIGYRVGNIEDDQRTVENLIERFSPKQKIADLEESANAA